MAVPRVVAGVWLPKERITKATEYRSPRKGDKQNFEKEY
jgi:hypothetical protein